MCSLESCSSLALALLGFNPLLMIKENEEIDPGMDGCAESEDYIDHEALYIVAGNWVKPRRHS